MYACTFLYPRPTTRSFDYDYLVDVHMPMGLELTRRFLSIQAAAFHIERFGENDPESTLPHAAIVHILFESMAEIDRFLTLHSHKEALELMSEDWRNYTDQPPEMRIGRWTSTLDVAASIALYQAKLGTSA